MDVSCSLDLACLSSRYDMMASSILQENKSASSGLKIPDDCADLKWMQSDKLDESRLSSSVKKIIKLWKSAAAEPAGLEAIWAKHACRHSSVQ